MATAGRLSATKGDVAAVETSTWCDEYRDIIGFYYWEPQHLGRMKNPNSPYSTFELSWEHVARMEVALNHLLNIYFSMVPLSLLNDEADWFASDAYRFVGTVELEFLGRQYSGFTQPDLLFRGNATDCAMELKTNGTVGLRQIQKYALLQALSAPSHPLTLVVMTPHTSFAGAFQNTFTTSEAITSALLDVTIPHGLTNQLSQDTYEEVVRALKIVALTYEDLAGVIRARMSREDSDSVIALNAHQGILTWLGDRGLIKAAG